MTPECDVNTHCGYYLRFSHFDRRATKWPEVEKSIKSRFSYFCLFPFTFLLPYHSAFSVRSPKDCYPVFYLFEFSRKISDNQPHV